MLYNLKVSDAIKEKYPDYRMDIIYVKGIDNKSDFDSISILREAEENLRGRIALEGLKECQEISGWRETYSKFGTKARSAVSAVEALCQRVLKGDEIPDINHIVNIYNAISIKYLIPIGGEDWDTLTSDLTFIEAEGTEPFKCGEKSQNITYPKPSEPVWADYDGVTCRRWNWRQCTRTQITKNTVNAYFVLDLLPNFDEEIQREAKAELIYLLSKLSQNVDVVEDSLVM